MTRLRRATLAITSLVAVAVMAACSSSASNPAATTIPSSGTPSETATAPTSAPDPTDTSTPSPSAASSTATEPASTSASESTTACAESQLRASVTSQNVPDFHVVRLVFANTSTKACTLTGFPGAAIVDSSGAQIQQAKRVIGGPVAGTVEQKATLTVSPGDSVFAYLEGQSTKKPGTAQAGCDAPDYPKILVTPPDTRTAVPFTIGWPPCYTFDVHPVRQQ